MDSSIASNSKITSTSATEFALPDASWDEGRLLDYMRDHDKAIGGLERKTLQHEFCFGAAAQLKYEELDGKWTAWAKVQGYPQETFRRRRLLFVRAGGIKALDKYDGKMAAYYDLGIYRKPSRKKLEALDAQWEAKAQGNETEAKPQGNVEKAKPSVQDGDGNAQTPGRNGAGTEPEGEEAEETLDDSTAPINRHDAPMSAEILGKIGNLLLEVERLGPDDSCIPLLDDIATTVGRLRYALEGKGVAA